MSESEAVVDGDARAEWIARFLGVQVPRRNAAERAVTNHRAVWTDAKKDVDAALGELARHLLASRDALLQRIGSEGIPRLAAQHDAALEAALAAYERAPPERRREAAAALSSAVARYRTALAEEAAFRLIDENPFGIAIAARERLGGALSQIAQSLG